MDKTPYFSYSVLYNDGRNNIQNDFKVFNMKKNHTRAIERFEDEYGEKVWAVLVDVATGKVVKSLKPKAVTP